MLHDLQKILNSSLLSPPVLDTNNSAYDNMSKCLVQIMKDLHEKIVKDNVKDFHGFVDNTKNLSVKNNNDITKCTVLVQEHSPTGNWFLFSAN